jgi:hypothetical protein
VRFDPVIRRVAEVQVSDVFGIVTARDNRAQGGTRHIRIEKEFHSAAGSV